MQTTCEACGRTYDDSRWWTYCPHAQFLSNAAAIRKDDATRLLGGPVFWNTDTEQATPLQIVSVAFDGMVTIRGYSGLFAPSLFQPEKPSG